MSAFDTDNTGDDGFLYRACTGKEKEVYESSDVLPVRLLLRSRLVDIRLFLICASMQRTVNRAAARSNVIPGRVNRSCCKSTEKLASKLSNSSEGKKRSDRSKSVDILLLYCDGIEIAMLMAAKGSLPWHLHF